MDGVDVHSKLWEGLWQDNNSKPFNVSTQTNSITPTYNNNSTDIYGPTIFSSLLFGTGNCRLLKFIRVMITYRVHMMIHAYLLLQVLLPHFNNQK